MKWNKLNIDNRDCRGLYLWWDFAGKEITSADIDDKHFKLNGDYKIQIRMKIDGKIAKKVRTYPKNKTIRGAIDLVNAERLNLKSEYRENGTLKPAKIVPQVVEKVEDFETAWSEYLEYIQSPIREDGRKPVSYNTIKTYCSMKKKHYSSISMDTAQEDIQKLIQKLIKEDYADGYIKLAIAPLRTMFKDKININKLITPKVENTRTFDYTEAQTKKLFQLLQTYEVPTRYVKPNSADTHTIRSVFAFLLQGRRISEVLTLKYSDINYDKNTYTIRKVNSKSGVELDFYLEDYLLPHVKKGEGIELDNLIYRVSAAAVRSRFYKLLKANKLPQIHLHDIRHMVATTALNAGANIADVSRALGHSTISTTEKRYVNKKAEMGSRATSIMRDALNGEK